MFPRRPGHLRAFDYLGLRRYFLTFATSRRQRAFTSAEPVALVLAQFRRAARDQGFAITAYCFMPDHVHLVVAGLREDSDLLRFIARAKQFAGYHFKRRFGPPLWQADGYEHVLRQEEATEAVVKYVIENPIRAGLAGRIEEYPYVGSDVYSLSDLLDLLQSQ